MDHLPDCNSRYKDVEYWDDRYQKEESFEWFGGFSKFKHLLEDNIRKDDTILVLGCGNSSLSSDMYHCGYRSITNIDYSAVCIQAMAGRYAHCQGMTWLKMDARELAFPASSFHVVLEKGTLDALAVGEKDPWNVSPQTACLLDRVLDEVSRVLKPGGRFVSVTFAQPHFRKRVLARRKYGWSIRCRSYGEGLQYFLYILTKGEELSPADQALEEGLLKAADPSQCIVSLQEPDTEDFLHRIGL